VFRQLGDAPRELQRRDAAGWLPMRVVGSAPCAIGRESRADQINRLVGQFEPRREAAGGSAA
jgi:hypothetical protein